MNPMPPDELDAIRARHRNLVDYGPVNAAVDDVGALLVEVDRLRAEREHLLGEWRASDHQIVRILAECQGEA